MADIRNSSALRAMKFYGQGLTVLVVGSAGLVGNLLAIATIISMARQLRKDSDGWTAFLCPYLQLDPCRVYVRTATYLPDVQ